MRVLIVGAGVAGLAFAAKQGRRARAGVRRVDFAQLLADYGPT
jgi:2-polyprenyl-6-methoxyphenol hydroxylase-like FAD-dependent oxidoreductase